MKKLTFILIAALFLTFCEQKTTSEPESSPVKTEKQHGCELLSIIVEPAQVQTPEQVILADALNFDETLGHYKYPLSEEDARRLEISEGDECIIRICKNNSGEAVVRIMKTKIPATDTEASYKHRQDFKASAFCYQHY